MIEPLSFNTDLLLGGDTVQLTCAARSRSPIILSHVEYNDDGSNSLVILHEPRYTLLESLVERGKLESACKLQQLGVRGGFTVLTISFGGIELLVSRGSSW